MRPSQGKSDRAAYRRAMRWKKNPVRRIRARIWSNGSMRWTRVAVLRPVDPAMQAWITEKELLEVLRSTWSL